MREVAAAMFVLLAANPVAAEDAIVITASRTADESPSERGIERVDEEAAALPSVTDLLDATSGVRAYRKGGIGGSTYFGLRGGEPNHTGVYIAGALVNDPSNSQGGSFDLSSLSPLFVERLRVVPGALSAVHGADALSGALFVDLRRGAGEFGAELLGGVDSDGGYQLAALGDLPVGGAGSLAAGIAQYERRSERQGAKLERLSGYAAGDIDAGPLSVGATLLLSDIWQERFPEDSGGPRLGVNRERETRDGEFALAALDARLKLPDGIEPFARLSWSRSAAEIDTPFIAPGVLDGVPAIFSDTAFERFDLSGGVVWTASPALTLALGADRTEEDGVSEGVIDFGILIPADFEIERGRTGLFAEATFAPVPEVSLTGAVRRDDADGEEAEWTARLSARLSPFEGGPQIFGSYAEGYKLPSLYALAYPIIANPALRPERSETFELGLAQPLGETGEVRIVAFSCRYTDLIDFEPTLFTNVNRAEIDTSGAELSADYSSGPWRVRTSVSYLGTDVPPGTPALRSRPEWQAAASGSWRSADGLEAIASFRAVSSSIDSSVATGRVRLGGHALVDVGIRVPVAGGLAVTGGIDNLLDADFEESVGVPALGRTAHAALSVRF